MAEKISRGAPTLDLGKGENLLNQILSKIGNDAEDVAEEKIKEGVSKGVSEGMKNAMKSINTTPVNLDEALDLKRDELKANVKKNVKKAIKDGTQEAIDDSSTVNIDLGKTTTVDNSGLTKKVQDSAEDSIESGIKNASKKSKVNVNLNEIESKIKAFNDKKSEFELKVKTDNVEKANQKIKELISSTESQIKELSGALDNELAETMERYLNTASTNNVYHMSKVRNSYKNKISDNELTSIVNWINEYKQIRNRANKRAVEMAYEKYGDFAGTESFDMIVQSFKKQLIPQLQASSQKRLLKQLGEEAQKIMIEEWEKKSPPSKIMQRISDIPNKNDIKNDYDKILIPGTTEVSTSQLKNVEKLVGLVAQLYKYYHAIGQKLPTEYAHLVDELVNNNLMFGTSDQIIKDVQTDKNQASNEIDKIKNTKNITKEVQQQASDLYAEYKELRKEVQAFIFDDCKKLKKAIKESMSVEDLVDANREMEKLNELAKSVGLDKNKNVQSALGAVFNKISDVEGVKGINLEDYFDSIPIKEQTIEIEKNTDAKKENKKETASGDTSDIDKETKAYEEETSEVKANTDAKEENNKQKSTNNTDNTEKETDAIAEQTAKFRENTDARKENEQVGTTAPQTSEIEKQNDALTEGIQVAKESGETQSQATDKATQSIEEQTAALQRNIKLWEIEEQQASSFLSSKLVTGGRASANENLKNTYHAVADAMNRYALDDIDRAVAIVRYNDAYKQAEAKGSGKLSTYTNRAALAEYDSALKVLQDHFDSTTKHVDYLKEELKKLQQTAEQPIVSSETTSESISQLDKLQQELEETQSKLVELKKKYVSGWVIETILPDGSSITDVNGNKGAFKTKKEAQQYLKINDFPKNAKIVKNESIPIEYYNEITSLQTKERDLLKEINKLKAEGTNIPLQGETTENIETTTSSAINTVDRLQSELEETANTGRESSNIISQGLENITSTANETANAIQRIAYHWGNLGMGLPSHQFGDEIKSWNVGKRNGGRGWADGTGTYVTNNPNEFKRGDFSDDLKKFYAFDTSKLKLYEQHVEEGAKAYYEFSHRLEQYCYKIGVGFKGFDDNLQDVIPETLYKEIQQLFGESALTFDEFNRFLKETAKLVKESGINADGTINAMKMNRFKKKYGTDDIKTTFLKGLGYQGTDFSGTSFGGIQNGSVIFQDAPKIIIATATSIDELVEKLGVEIPQAAGKASESMREISTPSISEATSEQNKLQAELDETDQKARELAKTFTTAFHNSDNTFDTFDTMMRGQHGDLAGKASYFSTSKNDSFAKADFGKYQTEWALDLQKTFNIVEGFTEEQINQIMKQFFADLSDELQNEIRNALKAVKLNAKPSIATIQQKGGVDFGNILGSLGYDSSYNSLLGELAVYDNSRVKRANNNVRDNTTGQLIADKEKIIEKENELQEEVKETGIVGEDAGNKLASGIAEAREEAEKSVGVFEHLASTILEMSNYNGKSLNRKEQGLYANLDNGLTSELKTSKYNNTINTSDILKTVLGQVDTFIHSHPEQLAAFSPQDIQNLFKETKKGIMKALVVSFDEVASFDASKIDAKDFDIINKTFLSKLSEETNKLEEISFKQLSDITSGLNKKQNKDLGKVVSENISLAFEKVIDTFKISDQIPSDIREQLNKAFESQTQNYLSKIKAGEKVNPGKMADDLSTQMTKIISEKVRGFENLTGIVDKFKSNIYQQMRRIFSDANKQVDDAFKNKMQLLVRSTLENTLSQVGYNPSDILKTTSVKDYVEGLGKTQPSSIINEIPEQAQKAKDAIAEVTNEARIMADVVERAFRLDTHTTPMDSFVKTALGGSMNPPNQPPKPPKNNITVSGQEMYEDMVISANRAKQAEQSLEDENEELIGSMRQLKQASNGQYFEDLEVLDENTKPRLYADAIHNLCNELEATQNQARLTAEEIRNMQNSFTDLNGLDIMGDAHQAKIDFFEKGGWIRKEDGTFEGHNAYTKALNKVMNQKTSYRMTTNPETKEKELERFDTYDVNYDKLLKEIISDDTTILDLERKISQASESEATPLREILGLKKQELAVYEDLMKYMAAQPEYKANHEQLATITAIRALNEEEIRNKYLAEDAAKAEKEKAKAAQEAAATQQKAHDDWRKSHIDAASTDNKSATKAYDELYAKASRYYELLTKEDSGKLNQPEEIQELAGLKQAWDEATRGVQKYTRWANGSAESLEKLDAARARFLNNAGDDFISQKKGSYDKTLLKIDDMLNSKKFTHSYTDQLDELRKKIIEINKTPIDIDTKDGRAKLKELDDQISNILGDKGLSSNKKAAQTSLNKLSKSIEDVMRKNSAMGNEFKQKFENLKLKINTAESNADVEKLKAEIIALETELMKAGKTGKSFMDTLKERIVGVNAQFIAQYFSIQDWIRYIRQASQEVIALDTAITELRKVSDASNDRLAQSFEKSAKTAQELGQTIEHVINVTADWSRLGYSVDDAEELARVTALFTTVGDNMTADDASSYLISTLQGFHIAADDAEAVIDKYNEVKFASIYSNVNASVYTG